MEHIENWMNFLLMNKSQYCESEDFHEMIMEWDYLPLESFYSEVSGECSACGHRHIHYHKCIVNVNTGKKFYVGSSCIRKVENANRNLRINDKDKKSVIDGRLAYLRTHHPQILQRLLKRKNMKLYYSEANEIIKSADVPGKCFALSFKLQYGRFDSTKNIDTKELESFFNIDYKFCLEMFKVNTHIN